MTHKISKYDKLKISYINNKLGENIMPSFRTAKGKTVNFRIGNDNYIYTDHGTRLPLRISGTNVLSPSGTKVGTTANLDVLCQMEYKKIYPDT